MVMRVVGRAAVFSPAPNDRDRELAEDANIMTVNIVTKKPLTPVFIPAMKYVIRVNIILGNSLLGISSASSFPKK